MNTVAVNTELLKAGLSLIVGVVVLLLGWFVGQRLTVRWNLVQKQREADLADLQHFYALYGEFKEVSKLWRVMKRNTGEGFDVPKETRWSLVSRACGVESKNEAIVVKLATERDLSADAMRHLGLFRQALQKLRESIRDDVEIPFASRGPAYVFFNDVAAMVATIVSSSQRDKSSDPSKASGRLETIANVRLPDFDRAMDDFAKNHPQLVEDGNQPPPLSEGPSQSNQ